MYNPVKPNIGREYSKCHYEAQSFHGWEESLYM